jgi:hypothetical protein
MSPDQIAVLLAAYPPIVGTNPTERIRAIGFSSGRFLIVGSSPGLPVRYNLTFDSTNELVVFSPAVLQSSDPNTSVASDIASYGEVETISFFG